MVTGFSESTHLDQWCDGWVVVVDSLVFDRGAHSQGGVASLPDVEDFEVFEDSVGQHLMRVRHRRRSRSSTCIRAQKDSINALSKQSPTDPIEGTRPDWPDWCARSVNAQEVKGVPWSEWITVSASGWRLPIAIPRAEVTRPAVAERSMDQPTTRRLNTSSTTAQ